MDVDIKVVKILKQFKVRISIINVRFLLKHNYNNTKTTVRKLLCSLNRRGNIFCKYLIYVRTKLRVKNKRTYVRLPPKSCNNY